MEFGLIVRHDADGAVCVQIARELVKLPALRLKLLERPLEERVVVGLKPDLAAERQELGIQREKRAPREAALFLPRLFPRVGEIDLNARDLARLKDLEQVLRVKVQKAHVRETSVRHALHADDHRVRHLFDRREQHVRVLLGRVRREAALAAADLHVQGLVAREGLQPFAAQRLGIFDLHRLAALHARDQIRFLPHSHASCFSISISTK